MKYRILITLLSIIVLLLSYETIERHKSTREKIKYIIEHPDTINGSNKDLKTITDLVERAKRLGWTSDKLFEVFKIANIKYQITDSNDSLTWVDVETDGGKIRIGINVRDSRVYCYRYEKN